ncbi:hypothetical protein BCON_0110g00360 [Botryotinia convoluta]|uniref:Uncharacterized protein n=1 Tax=Botryotinia convoluta TaxID=54673 RepID=A0A4Z1HYU4_9HELO|nr:hypothetical protein BCON_0110g00360 [Botryotinia convoluta]
MASNISFEGQLPKTLSRDTLCDSGSEILGDGSNDRLIIYFLTSCLLALLFGATVLLFCWSRSEIKLKKIVKKVDKIVLKIQMKDMEIKMNEMEMKVDDLEGKVDEKLTQERLDHQAEMLDWKAQAQKEKDDLEVEIPKLQNKICRIQRCLKKNFLYI